ncbi:MAG TPA: hypothetical protein VJN64_08635 [Terriglobales bacterium]|nr:hypothetical protein [Terriglobales bacterium]
MRSLFTIAVFLFLPCFALCQGTPPIGPDQLAGPPTRSVEGTPPLAPAPGPLKQIKNQVKNELERVMMRTCPAREEWTPPTPGQKFQAFVRHTYAPRTFAAAAVDSVRYKIAGDDPHYEHGFPGFAQHYGVELATSESDVFFERFLVPTLLRQDPRYFRAPSLPFFKRVLYSVSRVVITRTDDGSETFNYSRVVGGAASQALSDLYVPGQRQGLEPIGNRVLFDMARDAGFNLLHEFWPDLRRKVFHK